MKSNAVPRLLYRRATAARLLDKSVSSLKRYEQEGILHPVRLGRRGISYRAEEIEALANGKR